MRGTGAGVGEEDCEAEATVGACYEDRFAGARVGGWVYGGVGVVVDLGGEGKDWSLLVWCPTGSAGCKSDRGRGGAYCPGPGACACDRRAYRRFDLH